jgi:hypothetical protein
LRDLTQAHRRPLLIAAGSQLARQLVLTQALLEDSLALLLDLLVVALQGLADLHALHLSGPGHENPGVGGAREDGFLGRGISAIAG